MVSIRRTTILVNDLDAAIDFYVDAFVFDTLFDGEVAPGMRTLHVWPDGPRGAGLWLMKTTSQAGRDRVGAQIERLGIAAHFEGGKWQPY